MTEISRTALFGRLNPTTLKAIENATTFCKMRGNPYVELVHWLHLLVQDPNNDIAAIRRAFGLDDTALAGTWSRRSIPCRAAPPRSPTSLRPSRRASRRAGFTPR